MSALPHWSPRLVVGIGSLLLALVATYATLASPGYPGGVHRWPFDFLARLRRDLPRGDRVTLAWVGAALWSVAVTALHFGGLRYGVYTSLPWWDLLTHAMGGLGVAAVLALTHRRSASALRSPWWLVPAVLAIGAGFEVYEFVFKTFWYGWSLRFYVVDTAIDLVVNSSGAVVVAAAAAACRSRTDAPGRADASDRTDAPDRSDAPDDDAPTVAEPSE